MSMYSFINSININDDNNKQLNVNTVNYINLLNTQIVGLYNLNKQKDFEILKLDYDLLEQDILINKLELRIDELEDELFNKN